MSRERKLPEKLSRKVHVLVKYINDDIYRVLDIKNVRAAAGGGSMCDALWPPENVFYPAEIVAKNESKEELHKLKSRLEKDQREKINSQNAKKNPTKTGKAKSTSVVKPNEKFKTSASEQPKKKQAIKPIDRGEFINSLLASKKTMSKKAIDDAQHRRKLKDAVSYGGKTMNGDDRGDTGEEYDDRATPKRRKISHKPRETSKDGHDIVEENDDDDDGWWTARKRGKIPPKPEEESFYIMSDSDDEDDEEWGATLDRKKITPKLKNTNSRILTIKDSHDEDKEKRQENGDKARNQTSLKLRQVDSEEEVEDPEKLKEEIHHLKEMLQIKKNSTHTASKVEDVKYSHPPAAGEYSEGDARRLNLVPLLPGSSVYLSPGQLATAANGVSSPTILTFNLLRVFFKKEVVRISNYNGGGTMGYQPLNKVVTQAIIGYVKMKMVETKTSTITQAINTYCTRVRFQMKKGNE